METRFRFALLYIAIISTIIFAGPLLKPSALWGSHGDRFVSEETTIMSMNVGEAGYTVPWSLTIDENGKPWLNKYFAITRQFGGTASVLVTRTKEGFEVDVSRSKYARDWQWMKKEIEDFEKPELIPVISITD